MNPCPYCSRIRTGRARVVALLDKERVQVRAILLDAVARGEDDEGVLNDVAEMLLGAMRPGELGAVAAE